LKGSSAEVMEKLKPIDEALKKIDLEQMDEQPRSEKIEVSITIIAYLC